MNIFLKNTVNSYVFQLRLKRILLFFVFLVLCINAVFSQENDFEKIEAFKDFESYKILDIYQDQNKYIWFSSDRGILQFDGIQFTKINTKKANALFSKNDTLFIGTDKGLAVKTKKGLFNFKGKEVRKIFYHNKQLYVGSNQGILQFKTNYLQPLKTTYNLDFSVINDLIFYNNFFYIASNNGLWKLDKLHQPTAIKKLKSGKYNSFLKLNSTLLVVENNNAIISIVGNENFVQKYLKDGILSISHIQNEIYVTTKNNGITVLEATNFNFKKSINKYNSNLKTNTIFRVFKDVEKNVFIATNNGVFIKKNAKKAKAPNLIIQDVFVNFVPLDSLNNAYSKETLLLKSHQNNISFLFKSIAIQQSKNIEYRFQLNNDFSPWSATNRVDFANLKYGNYDFIVESRFKNSNETSRKKFSFNIDTPFYTKAWFVILLIAIFCFLLALIIDVYIRKINKKNQQKIQQLKLENHLLSLEHKALQLQMNPHFIFNVLNGIKALGNAGNTKELNKTVSQFSVLLRSVLNNSRLEEISLKDEIKTLTNYLDLEQKMSSKSFQYQIKTNLQNIDVEEILIPPMLVQPFVENAIKHGIYANQEGKITISFEIKQQYLECTITDNGIGFYQSKKTNNNTSHKSVALKITKERIENLSKKGSFTIEEIKEENHILGTKVWFKIPLKTDY
ncbi:histidine kinase [Polaribacter batillariae]|uniref:Histidine kinase n=1 Tax=Polaribacter batillariae TaxID=2808900 RepID=A0ABX7SXK9_9FLAO|nr:histidine kinase [Polaribacter batillariae]QTD38241.1 histidine kinase [Polaribacter batillariae]